MSDSMIRRAVRLPRTLIALILLIPGCAAVAPAPARPDGALSSASSTTTSTSAPANASTSTSTNAPARPSEPPLRPFETVIKEAQRIPGLFDLWRKDEKLWIEIRPEQLDRPFLFSSTLARGLAQFPFVAGLLGDAEMASFHRIGNQVQLIAHNTMFRTQPGSPLARAARDSVSDSILASAAVASAAHEERKSFLIDANAMLLGDVAGLGALIDAAFRLGYTLDKPNSSIDRARGGQDETLIAVNLHYSVAKLPAPPSAPTSAPPPAPPRAVPDPRSFLLGVQYRMAALPEPPMPMRLADERVGYFVTDFRDLTRAYSAETRVRVADRWRLEKKDPAAALSEPKQPIVAVLDRNIPADLRPYVEAGVLEWNQAFEQAGFKNAIVARQQPDDADWDALEGRHIAVKWFVDSSAGGTAAIGPHLSDPRTGEILYGAVLIPDLWARISGLRYAEVLPPRVWPGSGPGSGSGASGSGADALACTYAFDALGQTAFSLALLGERGEFASAAASDDFIHRSIKAVVVHEMGHALGLRHNFLATHAIKSGQLRDPEFTQAHGLSASIMDYVPDNLPLDGETRVARLQMDSIGAYDRWAIEWGYRQFAPDDPDGEQQALDRIAARSASDPMLAYATDEDAGQGSDQMTPNSGIDPRVNRFDLGDDPLAFYRRQIALARELWSRTEQRPLAANDDFRLYRRNLERGMAQMRSVAPNVAKSVGGLYVERVRAGAGSALLTPVQPRRQRAALQLLTTELFAPSSFRFDPGYMRRLGVDQFGRSRGDAAADVSPDFSLPAAVLGVQRPVLDQLMSEQLAQRLADAESKSDDPRALLGFSEVQATLAAAVWQELAAGQDIGSLRRNLQREHLRRLAAAVIKPAAASNTDVRSVFRAQARRLQARLQSALDSKAPRGDAARAHLAESLQILREALRAPIMKTGV